MNRFDKQLITEAYISNNQMRVVFEQNSDIPPEVKTGFEKFVEMALKLQEEQEKGTKLNPEQQQIIDAFSDPTGKKLQEIFNKIQQESPTTNVQKEAFEKFRSNLSSVFNNTGPTGAINKRYDLFLKDINGHLWEVDEDAKTLNVKDTEIQNFINKILTIEPEIGKKGKFLQKLGYGVGRAVGTMAFAAPFAVAATYLAPTLGIYGASAKVLGSALAAGGKTATVFTNKRMSTREKLYSILATAFAGYKLTVGGTAPSADVAGSTVTRPNINPAQDYGGASGAADAADAVPDPGVEFPVLHGSVADSASKLDAIKQTVADILRDKGLAGTSHGVTGVASPTIMNAMDVAGINTTSEYTKVLKGLANLHRSVLGHMQSDPNYAVKILRKLK